MINLWTNNKFPSNDNRGKCFNLCALFSGLFQVECIYELIFVEMVEMQICFVFLFCFRLAAVDHSSDHGDNLTTLPIANSDL